ncbi:MAG: hypothetical protein SVU94_12620, partial [Bacteroidota bacterium]|nr:hypothetical protein [Bacteroidota bacterium]
KMCCINRALVTLCVVIHGSPAPVNYQGQPVTARMAVILCGLVLIFLMQFVQKMSQLPIAIGTPRKDAFVF